MTRNLSEIHAERMATWRAFQNSTNATVSDRLASDLRWLHDEWQSHPNNRTWGWLQLENVYRANVQAYLG